MPSSDNINPAEFQNLAQSIARLAIKYQNYLPEDFKTYLFADLQLTSSYLNSLADIIGTSGEEGEIKPIRLRNFDIFKLSDTELVKAFYIYGSSQDEMLQKFSYFASLLGSVMTEVLTYLKVLNSEAIQSANTTSDDIATSADVANAWSSLLNRINEIAIKVKDLSEAESANSSITINPDDKKRFQSGLRYEWFKNGLSQYEGAEPYILEKLNTLADILVNQCNNTKELVNISVIDNLNQIFGSQKLKQKKQAQELLKTIASPHSITKIILELKLLAPYKNLLTGVLREAGLELKLIKYDNPEIYKSIDLAFVKYQHILTDEIFNSQITIPARTATETYIQYLILYKLLQDVEKVLM